QLDTIGANLLRGKMQDMGVEVLTGKKVLALEGSGVVTGVRFSEGDLLETDMVVISCGIQPNVELARTAGLRVDRGILVDDQLRTSEAGIYAVGECAQHNGRC